MREGKEKVGITEGERGEGEREGITAREDTERWEDGGCINKEREQLSDNTETRSRQVPFILLTHDTYQFENLYHKWHQHERVEPPSPWPDGEMHTPWIYLPRRDHRRASRSKHP